MAYKEILAKKQLEQPGKQTLNKNNPPYPGISNFHQIQTITTAEYGETYEKVSTQRKPIDKNNDFRKLSLKNVNVGNRRRDEHHMNMKSILPQRSYQNILQEDLSKNSEHPLQVIERTVTEFEKIKISEFVWSAVFTVTITILAIILYL